MSSYTDMSLPQGKVLYVHVEDRIPVDLVRLTVVLALLQGD